jgi:predicted site-specific integrase-resolvase
MKLSEWAKQQGLTYRTAWKLFRDGNLPVPAEQLSTGTIVVQAMSYSTVLEAALRLPKDDRKRIIEEMEKSVETPRNRDRKSLPG